MKYVIFGRNIVGRVIYDPSNHLWVIKNNRGTQLGLCEKKDILTQSCECWRDNIRQTPAKQLMILTNLVED